MGDRITDWVNKTESKRREGCSPNSWNRAQSPSSSSATSWSCVYLKDIVIYKLSWTVRICCDCNRKNVAVECFTLQKLSTGLYERIGVWIKPNVNKGYKTKTRLCWCQKLNTLKDMTTLLSWGGNCLVLATTKSRWLVCKPRSNWDNQKYREFIEVAYSELKTSL